MERKFLIVGAGWAGRAIAAIILEDGKNCIVGFVDDRHADKEINFLSKMGRHEYRVVGRSDRLLELAREYGADAVVIAVTHDREDHLLSQMVKCHQNGIPIFEMPNLYAKLTKKIPVRHVNHHWVSPNLTVPRSGFYSLFSTWLNYCLGWIGFLFFLIPLFPFFALAIKLDSSGPVFFKQKRVGQNGQPFWLLKFRTMKHSSDTSGESWTKKGDSRITRVGHLLRKFRIDELPQMVNVVKGEMAVIGPRPEAVELVEEFRKHIPFYDYRYLVRPGITGWAQVNYGNTCSIEGALEKLQYDLYWIKHRSILLDIKIVFKSVRVILTGFGSV